ncbi:uncharacterized protein LOC112575085 isoform X2 [Pomacea canaliculata]|nr:uncharacterized protein LOC112575085 isoform X2 [Pomacea canaliculata]
MATARMQRTVATRLMLLLAIVACKLGVDAKVDYVCTFGPMLSTQGPDGTLLHFCSTGMQPPFVTRGHYIVATDSANPGRCFECVCEDDIGMACCERPCPSN